ncbi:MAG: sulfotransferase [Alphaproteobacteria bacterium]
MASNSHEGPDFICIGMPKSGTGWLFDQLKYHPDFWMPPIKELAYLSHGTPRLKAAQRRFDAANTAGGLQKFSDWANRRTDDSRDLAFLKEVNDSVGREIDLEFYSALFSYKEGALSGDISSGYGLVDPEIVSGLEQRLPSTKIFLLVRDPVARAWSHISMWHRAGTVEKALLRDPDAFRNFLEGSVHLQKISFPSRIVAHWREAAPTLKFRSFLFDEIAENPVAARREILLYLGADPGKQSGPLEAGYNKKATNKKLKLHDRAKSVLVDYFKEELAACAELFGERGKIWARRYGVL